MHLVFILFLFFFSEINSQVAKESKLFLKGIGFHSTENSLPIYFSTSNLSTLQNIERVLCFASSETQSLNVLFADNKNVANRFPLVFAKVNFFGMENLEQRDDTETLFKEDDSSFWDNEVIYFVIGALAATGLYIVWQNSGSKNSPQKTFGLPPKPKGLYGL